MLAIAVHVVFDLMTFVDIYSCPENSDSEKVKQIRRLVSCNSTAGSDAGPVKSQAAPDSWQAFRVTAKRTY